MRDADRFPWSWMRRHSFSLASPTYGSRFEVVSRFHERLEWWLLFCSRGQLPTNKAQWINHSFSAILLRNNEEIKCHTTVLFFVIVSRMSPHCLRLFGCIGYQPCFFNRLWFLIVVDTLEYTQYGDGYCLAVLRKSFTGIYPVPWNRNLQTSKLPLKGQVWIIGLIMRVGSGQRVVQGRSESSKCLHVIITMPMIQQLGHGIYRQLQLMNLSFDAVSCGMLSLTIIVSWH